LQLAGELLSDPLTPNVRLILCDIVEPKAPKGAKHVVTRKADLCDPKEIDALFNTEFGVPDTIYCFHGIMSRGSEDNFDLGLRVSRVAERPYHSFPNRPSSRQSILLAHNENSQSTFAIALRTPC
jgi:hypothetical protein